MRVQPRRHGRGSRSPVPTFADARADCAIVFHHLALRSIRIFPGRFDVVALAPGGDSDNLTSRVHAALVGRGAWGTALIDHLTADAAQQIYASHGRPGAAGLAGRPAGASGWLASMPTRWRRHDHKIDLIGRTRPAR